MASPAAMLSIMVNVRGVDSAARDLGNLDDRGKRAGGTLGKLGKTATLGAAAGIGIAAVAVKGFIDAAVESEKSSVRMQTQLKASGINYGKHADQIDKVIAKHSALSGFDDEDLQDSFSNIVRATGDVNKAMELNALAMDIARGRGISLEAASKMVTKAAAGQETAFSRLGIKIKDGATAQEAIATAQAKFSGQAKAYGDTAAGAQDRFKVALENLQEVLGAKLLPIVATVTGKVADFVSGMQTGEGAGGKFAEAIRTAWETVKNAVQVGVEYARAFLLKHKDDIDAARKAAENIAKAMKWAFVEVILPAIQAVMPTIEKIVKSTMRQIGGAFDLIIGIINGDWTRAWNGLKAIVQGAVDKMLAVLELAWPLFKAAGLALIKALIEGFKALPDLITGLAKWLWNHTDDGIKLYLASYKALGGWILDKMIEGLKALGSKVTDAVRAIKDAIVNKIKEVFSGAISIPLKIDLPKINLPFGGGGGGNVGPGGGNFSSVQGIANTSLAWGLSGARGPGQSYRPGDDGWHGQNRARDISGPAGRMLGFAQMLASSSVAGRLLELIHTPLGFGIKNGQRVPLSFWGSDVNADHYDHVHVALAKGGLMPKTGWALVGEQGPELYNASTGRVYSTGDSASMLGGGDVYVYIDGVEVNASRVVKERDRATRAAYRAGSAPA